MYHHNIFRHVSLMVWQKLFKNAYPVHRKIAMKASRSSETLYAYLEDWGVQCTVNGLADALREPEHAIKDISLIVKQKAMQQAEEALEQGETQKALSKVSRVLADAPQDEEAQKLLERLEFQGRQPRYL